MQGEGRLRQPVVVQFGKRAFPRGLKPNRFTGLIGAAEAAPLQGEWKLQHYLAAAFVAHRRRGWYA